MLIYRKDLTRKLKPEELDNNFDVLEMNTTVCPYYHFHGFAGGQVDGDGKFFDLTGFNHAAPTIGGNLSNAQIFANPGYVSTVDPIAGATDSVLRIPAINFDYVLGEKLIIWWLGKCLAEASGQFMLGDGYSTTVKGWGVMAASTQKLQMVLSGATQGYSGSSATSIFDGTLQSFGVVLDGAEKKYAFWSNGELDANFS